MNPIRTVYCRTFQTVFRIAIPFLPYREPVPMEDISQLHDLFRQLKINSLLLITDYPLRHQGVTAPLEHLLSQWGIRCTVYDRTRANPTTDNVEEARFMYIQNDCQCLVAFGGGSSMDCAKAVGARIAYPRKSLGQLKGILRVLRKIPPLIAIPTTAGTGSETTLAAVITDPVLEHKYVINSFPLIPSYAVLDARVTYTLPPHLTATTGLDALTHAVEAYIGRSTTKDTRAHALEATDLIFRYLERAYQDGRDHEAREGMLRASYLAGAAFTKSYVGYIHAVAHSLGGQYNIPHGLANSVLLPVFLEAYGESIHKKLHELAIAADISTSADSHAVGARKFIDAVRAMSRRMHIPEIFPQIKPEDIPTMAHHADQEANPLYPVPVLMTQKELESFYYQVSDWRV